MGVHLKIHKRKEERKTVCSFMVNKSKRSEGTGTLMALSFFENMFADVVHALHRKNVTATFILSGGDGWEVSQD